MLKDSVLVVAHPDDEVLWFSSILREVETVVICFLNIDSNSSWESGREQILKNYPLKDKNVISLGIRESESFNKSDWNNILETEYGVAVPFMQNPEDYSSRTCQEIQAGLASLLPKYQNVFTHNPWGEYGHEDHIQVYRVVRQYQEQLGFSLWYSNYCSNKSFDLMQRCQPSRASTIMTQPVDTEFARKIMNAYVDFQCWTWKKDWPFFREESFLKDVDASRFKNMDVPIVSGEAPLISLNMISIKPFRKDLLSRLKASIRGKLK